jgi:hypothetical protein
MASGQQRAGSIADQLLEHVAEGLALVDIERAEHLVFDRCEREFRLRGLLHVDFGDFDDAPAAVLG